MSGRLGRLIKKYGNAQLYDAYRNEVDGLIKSKLYDISSFSFNDGEEDTYIKLPSTFTKIDLELCSDARLLNYLSKRKITQDIIDRFNIGYTTWKEKEKGWKNRLIIPSYDEFGDLNYFVGRDITGKSAMKYKNCDADKKTIVFQESRVDFDSDIILCEGAIDCLYPHNAIALLGKTLKRDYKLYKVLMERARANVIICLDNDTAISETKKIYNILNTGRLKGHVLYIRMDKTKDIGDLYEKYGKTGIVQAVRSARQFTELDLIFE
jgi:DNA primase